VRENRGEINLKNEICENTFVPLEQSIVWLEEPAVNVPSGFEMESVLLSNAITRKPSDREKSNFLITPKQTESRLLLKHLWISLTRRPEWAPKRRSTWFPPDAHIQSHISESHTVAQKILRTRDLIQVIIKLTFVGLVVNGLWEFSPEPECPGIMVPQACSGAPWGLEEP